MSTVSPLPGRYFAGLYQFTRRKEGEPRRGALLYYSSPFSLPRGRLSATFSAIDEYTPDESIP